MTAMETSFRTPLRRWLPSRPLKPPAESFEGMHSKVQPVLKFLSGDSGRRTAMDMRIKAPLRQWLLSRSLSPPAELCELWHLLPSGAQRGEDLRALSLGT